MLYTLATFNSDGSVDETITLSVVSNFSEEYPSSLPQSSVESGYNLSDNMNLSNNRYTLNGIVSDSMFRVKSELVQYINGRFDKISPPNLDSNPISGRHSLLVKERIKKLRDNKEIFGVFISMQEGDQEANQIELIYPCALSGLSFKDDDGSEAVYPSLSFEKIRISTTKFEIVTNPSPRLVPYIKDKVNAGNQSGSTSSVDTPSDAEADIASQVEIGKKADSGLGERKGESTADKLVKGFEEKRKLNHLTIEANEKWQELNDAGRLKYGQKGAFVKAYVEARMKQ